MSERKFHTPPRIAHRFLEWFCPPKLFEGIEGDLIECFEENIHTKGIAHARTQFVWGVIKFFRPEIILRNKFQYSVMNTIMIGNYFKVASRNIAKRKMYSFINAFGLSVGIAFCILIFLFIRDEQSFDQFHVNRDRIYRLEEKSFDTWQQRPDQPYNRSAWLQVALQPALKAELPEVEFATRFSPESSGILRYNDKVFTERISFADADFFKMFSFPILPGNSEKLFQNLSDAVITPAVAKKYFGEEDPIGKVISIDCGGVKNYTIAAIIEAPPANSSIDFQILLAQENRPGYERNMKQWGNFNTPTFMQLVPGTDLENLNRKLDKLIAKYMGDKLEKWKKESTLPVPADVKMLTYEYTALADMHLRTEIDWHKVSDRQYSFILGGIAVLILLIACINYISLALTTSASRRTEVGIRKVVGAQKSQLIYQFGFESLLLAIGSMIIGIGLATLFLPAFNEFTGKGIQLSGNYFVQVVLASLAITIIVGVLAGSYPALFLAGFRPALVLKGRFTSKLQAGFTKPLVVLQFALSAFLIISSVIMYRQMNFITTKNLGYDQSHVLVIPTQSGWGKESDQVVKQFRTRIMQEPNILSVGGTSISFSKGYSRYGYKIDGEQKAAYVYGIDPQYIETLDIQLMEGRNFDERIPSDSNAVIVNEALVKDMKWTDPLNSYLNFKEDTVGMGAKVIGVVKDYHFRSLEAGIDPMFMSMDKEAVGSLTNILVKVKGDQVPDAMNRIQKVWKELYPDKPYDYSFLDDDVASQYKSYQRWMNIMGLSTGFAILISCLGLFGLAGVNAVNKTKEIGIRKVMGAELANIFVLLNKQYVLLSIIAFAIAIPFSWYVMNQWLSGFKFHIGMGWELFVVSMVMGLAVALLAVSYHSIKAALINPAETLKYE